jgi:hypothetical protein
MLSDEELSRVEQEVKQQTKWFNDAKTRGYAAGVVAMSTYDSQDDFERCRPNLTKGTDFRTYNEYVVEVMKGLRANGVPAEPVVVHYTEFEKFLNGKPITPESRSAFAAHLVQEASKSK